MDHKIWWNQSGKRLAHYRCSSEMVKPYLESHPIYRELYENLRQQEEKPHVVTTCKWGINEFYINPYGELHYCNIFWNTTYNLRKGSFRDAWENWYPHFRREEKDYCLGKKVLPTCGECPAGYIYNNTEVDASLSVEERAINLIEEKKKRGNSQVTILQELEITGRTYDKIQNYSRITL